MIEDNNYILILLLFLSVKDIIIIYFREKISYNLGILDIPNKRKIHLKPTPLIGGICIFTTLIILFIFQILESTLISKKLVIMNIFFLVFFLTGFADDKSHLSPKIRTIITISSILLLLSFEKSFLIYELNFFSTSRIINLDYISLLFTVFCIFALYNAFNFIDGVNGAATSIVLFWIIFLIINKFSYIYLCLLLTFSIIFVLIYRENYF